MDSVTRLQVVSVLIAVALFFAMLWIRGNKDDAHTSPINNISAQRPSENRHFEALTSEIPSWPLKVLVPNTSILSDSPIYRSPAVKSFFTKKNAFFMAFKKEDSSYQSQIFAENTPPPSMLSDSQIFEKIWPQSYRADLKKIEDIMLSDGFIKATERNAMATDADMFDFYRTLLRYMKDKHFVDDAKYNQFLHGINDVLPDILGKEKEGLRVRGDFRAVLPKDQHLAIKNAPKEVFNDVLDGLAYVFSFAEPASAAWVTAGDCYKDDAPWYPVPGPNLLAFCCNCGIQCTPTCHQVPDCGPQGALCIIPLGCLNLACRAWPNAIWDPTTGVCGCG